MYERLYEPPTKVLVLGAGCSAVSQATAQASHLWNLLQCNAGIGTNVMYERLYEPPTKVLVLGAGCSAVSQATAQASHLWNLLQLSYSSASPALSDKIKYKRFFRVFPPESSFNHARLDLLEMFEWKKVGTLYQDNEEIFKLTNNDFLTLAKQRGVQVLTSESFVTNPRL